MLLDICCKAAATCTAQRRVCFTCHAFHVEPVYLQREWAKQDKDKDKVVGWPAHLFEQFLVVVCVQCNAQLLCNIVCKSVNRPLQMFLPFLLTQSCQLSSVSLLTESQTACTFTCFSVSWHQQSFPLAYVACLDAHLLIWSPAAVQGLPPTTDVKSVITDAETAHTGDLSARSCCGPHCLAFH